MVWFVESGSCAGLDWGEWIEGVEGELLDENVTCKMLACTILCTNYFTVGRRYNIVMVKMHQSLLRSGSEKASQCGSII